MQAKTFFLINGIIVLFLITRLFFSAKRLGVSPLSSSDEPDAHQPPNSGKNQRASAESHEKHKTNASTFERSEARSGLTNDLPPKSLNCIFMFQGHTFDAFEVLGLPAGSPKDKCKDAYTAHRRENPDSQDFYDLAWRALERHFTN